MEHGFKSLVGLSKGRSVWWVPLPACNARKHSKSQCLKQGNEFFFCPRRQKPVRLWSIIKQALESFPGTDSWQQSATLLYPHKQSWEEPVLKIPAFCQFYRFFRSPYPPFWIFWAKDIPYLLPWLKTASPQITECVNLQAPSCSHAINTEIQADPSKRRMCAAWGRKRRRVPWC